MSLRALSRTSICLFNLYLSAFFERNKNLYYDNLTRVREKNDLMNWLKYFLTGVDETARQASNTLEVSGKTRYRLFIFVPYLYLFK